MVSDWALIALIFSKNVIGFVDKINHIKQYALIAPSCDLVSSAQNLIDKKNKFYLRKFENFVQAQKCLNPL